LIAALAGVVVLVAAAVVVRWVVLRDQARSVSTNEAVDRYREVIADKSEQVAENATDGVADNVAQNVSTDPVVASTRASMNPAAEVEESVEVEQSIDATTFTPTTTATTAATTVAAELPALVRPGVYRYATTGQESIDALDGATHAYPSETTITVTPSGCGVRLRWDALHERWDEWRLCATPGGIELQRNGTQYHEFFGQPDDEAVACDTTVLLLPTTTGMVPPVQQPCLLAEDPWAPSWEVLERSTRTVDGHDIDVRHVVMRIEDPDEYWEQTRIDWFLATDGLPVEVTSTKASLSPSPIGPVEYREEYRLVLVSLEPLR
jgi:hypothetical protein